MLDRSESDTELGRRVPLPFPRSETSELQRFLAELQAESDQLDGAIDAALKSVQLPAADGDSLDELAKDFGRLGRRRGRSDAAYRSFLLSLVRAFDGRGTPPGLRFAVAAGVLADRADVALIEDFGAQEYEVVLKDEGWSAHSSGTVRDLAELADPSVVQFREPVHNRLASVRIAVGVRTAERNSGTDLESASPRPTPGETVTETIDSEGTFGVGRFDGEGSFS